MWFRRKRERPVAEELRYHEDRLIEDYVRSGMDPEQARRRARLEFGGVDQISEAVRDVRGHRLEDFVKDVRYALRTLRRSPGFFVIAVGSLALGIGANTAIFSLINAVMLQSLPVWEPERLVRVARIMANGNPGVVSYPLYEQFRDNLTSISGAYAAMSSAPVIVMDGAEETVTAELVSGSHHAVLGVESAAGRLLEASDDDVSSATPAAVISYRYWQRRFGLDPAAIGKTFTIRNTSFTIVGVTPPRYQGARLGSDPDLTLPLTTMLTENQRRSFDMNMLGMIARLKPDRTVVEANAEVEALWSRLVQVQASRASERERPSILRQRAAALPAPAGLNPLRADYGQPLIVLMGIVALVLLLACANLFGLLLARAASRQREISIRLAIGAGRGRLVRQLLAESLVLSVLGGSAGLLLAYWFSARLVTLLANGGTLVLSTTPDWRVLMFTATVSLLACLLAGLAPAIHAVRANVNPALKEVRSGGHRRLSNAMVVAQLSISMVLLVGATLFVGTLIKLYALDRGLQTDGVLMFNVRTAQPYPAERTLTVQKALLDRLQQLPGVGSASVARVVQIGGGLWTVGAQVEGYTSRPDEAEEVGFNAVAPNYFATVRTPVVAGREFDDHDTETSTKVAVVNQSFARYFFGTQSPLGRHVTSRRVAYEIVGVVRDAKYQNLRDDVMKTMYVSALQQSGEQPSSYTYLARVAAGDPMRLAPALERLVRDADPALRLRAPRAYASVIDQTIVTERIMATLGGFFGGIALIVAALGVFGVMAFQVSRRTNELGVRMALGAGRRNVIALVLREVAVMLIIGVAVGGALAFTVTGLSRQILFGLTPTDPRVFALAATVLACAALAAGWLPARRAARVDPVTALRCE